jgi:hypothetical protein
LRLNDYSLTCEFLDSFWPLGHGHHGSQLNENEGTRTAQDVILIGLFVVISTGMICWIFMEILAVFLSSETHLIIAFFNTHDDDVQALPCQE